MRTIKAHGETAILDIEDITPDQGLQLAEALGRVLLVSGGLGGRICLTGPDLIQFADELVDQSA